MKKCIFLFCLSLMLAVPTVVQAAKAKAEYDIAKTTCKEIFSDAESITFMLFWIDGYLSHKNNNTMMSEASIKEIGEALTEECKENPKQKLGAILKEW